MKQDSPEKNLWLFPAPETSGAAFRLFCFPHAGGGASVFRQWQSHMPAQVQVCSVQLPGRENRMNEQACLVLSHLVERIFTGLYHLFDVPFAFFGHSLGAKIAFELARCAQQNKLPLRCLLVAASRAPHIREPRPLHHLPDQLFLQELRRYSATPEALLANQELMAVFLPLLRADFTLDETYTFQAGPPLACPLCVYGGEEDQDITLEELSAWRQHASGSFVLRMFPGGHFFIKSAVDRLLVQLNADLGALI